MLRTRIRTFVLTAASALFLLAPASASAQVDMFLRIDGIKGESVDAFNRDAIDVLAWSWGTSTGTARTGRGPVPAACIQDLSLTKWVDAASPQIIMNGVTGTVASDAVLSMRKGGESNRTDFLVLQMTNVKVTSYQTGGSGGENRLTEHVTLRFDSLRGEYRRQNERGGYAPPVVFTIGGAVCR